MTSSIDHQALNSRRKMNSQRQVSGKWLQRRTRKTLKSSLSHRIIMRQARSLKPSLESSSTARSIVPLWSLTSKSLPARLSTFAIWSNHKKTQVLEMEPNIMVRLELVQHSWQLSTAYRRQTLVVRRVYHPRTHEISRPREMTTT